MAMHIPLIKMMLLMKMNTSLMKMKKILTKIVTNTSTSSTNIPYEKVDTLSSKLKV